MLRAEWRGARSPQGDPRAERSIFSASHQATSRVGWRRAPLFAHSETHCCESIKVKGSVRSRSAWKVYTASTLDVLKGLQSGGAKAGGGGEDDVLGRSDKQARAVPARDRVSG